MNAPLLIPQLPAKAQAALAGGSDLTPQGKALLILEAEQEIYTCDRELREIDTLEERGVAGAGRLSGEQSLL